MRNGETFSVNRLVTKQHNVEVERAGAPAFSFAHAALLKLNTLGIVQQRFGIQLSLKNHGGVEVVWLILRPQRRGAIERGDRHDAALRDLTQRLYGSIHLLQR